MTTSPLVHGSMGLPSMGQSCGNLVTSGRCWGVISALVLASPVLACSPLHALEPSARAGAALPSSQKDLTLFSPSMGDRPSTAPSRVAIAIPSKGVEGELEGGTPSAAGSDNDASSVDASLEAPVAPEAAPCRDGEPEPSVEPPLESETHPCIPPDSGNPPEAGDPSEAGDPELGVLRLRNPSPDPGEMGDPELGLLRLWGGNPATADEELGILRLREREIEPSLEQPPAPPTVYLFAGVNYFGSNNIFLDALNPVDDRLVSGRISLGAFPALDRDTLMIVSLGGTVSLYESESRLNYADLNSRVGIRHFFIPRTYVELAWVHQDLFSLEDGDRFLTDDSLRLTLARRDFLAPRLLFDSFYQFRLSVANPADRSRITHTLGLYMGYDATTDLQLGLGYQLLLSTFTEEQRDDAYHQLLAQVSYNLSRRAQITLYGGVSFGRSSSPGVGFDSSIFGASLDLSVPLF